jgi:hypothetical protein
VAELSLRRLDCYRAVTASAHLWLNSPDPILAAFELVNDLHKCACEEPDYAVYSANYAGRTNVVLQERYGALNAQVRLFTGRVAQSCWSQDDIRTLIGETSGLAVNQQGDGAPRIHMALHYDVKEVGTRAQGTYCSVCH